MNDRELLELAAKAAGIKKPVLQDMRGWGEARYGLSEAIYDEEREEYWNPLAEDGDALRLAVKLGITVGPESPDVIGQSLCRASWNNRTMSLGEYGDGDPSKATRRAIVRAAAEIGRAMP